ncbi:hypothetical protein BZA05DRAFT_428089 [Tricharina praecox]|uniref:uncharacterized protein n=1 Tax=Tricharina praecox TaxID=43433 RepID=UPI00221E76CF|nr:uncharacterized protein BZA05DRAFT_428089 [Tricharina praecox]KAI5858874.1 hypothetical protein BZA05DRAFT_428089 [Tricharina praecox]
MLFTLSLPTPSTTLLLLLTATLPVVTAHGAIVSATGDAGGQGTALGIDAATPRDGTRRTPFQQDTTVFGRQQRGGAASASGCGRTAQSGAIDVPSAMADVVSQNGGLPQVTEGGQVSMTLHQVNADGAGPYACMVNADGTAQDFVPMQVDTNVPGRAGLSFGNGATDFPLIATMPAGMQCTGTSGAMTGVCIVRCQNTAIAGPFGGCVPVQMKDSSR